MENGFDSDQNCTLIHPAGICHWYVFMATAPCILMHFCIISKKTKGKICNVSARTRWTEGAHDIDCQYSHKVKVSRLSLRRTEKKPACWFSCRSKQNCKFQVNKDSADIHTTNTKTSCLNFMWHYMRILNNIYAVTHCRIWLCTCRNCAASFLHIPTSPFLNLTRVSWCLRYIWCMMEEGSRLCVATGRGRVTQNYTNWHEGQLKVMTFNWAVKLTNLHMQGRKAANLNC